VKALTAAIASVGLAAFVAACDVTVHREVDEAAAARILLAATFQRTTKVCQLTGNIDLETPSAPTGMMRGGGSHGITGTDIGWSFEHDGRLHFMFGDTRDFDPNRCDPDACGVLNDPIVVSPPPLARWTDFTGPNPQDLSDPDMYRDWLDTHGDSAESWASAPAGSNPNACLALRVATDGTGNHRSTLLNGRTLPRQEGAFSGFSDGANMLAFVTRKSWPNGCSDLAGCAHDNPHPGGKTSLALSRDGGASFDEIFHFSTTHFQFVAPNVVSGSLYPELTAERSTQNVLFAFGAGRSVIGANMTEWNRSYPYLAISDVKKVTQKTPTANGVTAFAHRVTWYPNIVGDPVALTGPAIGLAPEDKRILPYDDKVLVVRSDGYVWYQTIGLNSVGGYQFLPPRIQPSGYVPLVAVNPGDKWVVPDPKRNRLLVVTADGRVFAHLVTDHIERRNQLTTMAPVAARPQDNWVLVVRDRLIVITKRGLVYAHPFTGKDENTVGAATLLSSISDPDTLVAGTTSPGTPVDRWVFAMGDNIMTVTGQGVLYAHHIAQHRVVGKWEFFRYQRVGWSDQDRWLLPIRAASGDEFIIDITYKPTSFSYFGGLNLIGQPWWTSDENAAAPLWTDAHQCLGYFSARYLEPAKKWLALYTCNIKDVVERGVYLRTAAKPWGPWSAPTAVMMAAGTEDPYCYYMHRPIDKGKCPAGAPNPFEDEKRVPRGDQERAGRRNYGGEYAPFLLPSSYQRYNGIGTTRLFFTLSTWNPYQTVLMATDVRLQ
jgi:hypothetical protein